MPSVLRFLKGKERLFSEFKTPGDYLDLGIFKQMSHYQSASMEYLDRKGKLAWEKLDQIVILTLVSKLSEVTKGQLKRRKFQLLPFGDKEGIYQATSLVDHYIFVIDDLPFDSSILELFKYTKDKKRMKSFAAWIRENEEESKQKEMALEILELYPQFKKEVLSMIPVSTDPEVNREYISNVIKGFGVDDIVDYVKENHEEQAINRFIHNSENKVARHFIKEEKEETLLDQLIQEGMNPDKIRNYLNNLEKKSKK